MKLLNRCQCLISSSRVWSRVDIFIGETSLAKDSCFHPIPLAAHLNLMAKISLTKSINLLCTLAAYRSPKIHSTAVQCVSPFEKGKG